MVSSNKRVKITEAEWSKDLLGYDIPLEKMNKVIFDYLVIEGFKDAAEEFQKESGLQTNATDIMNSLKHRTAIREAMQTGNVQHAIEMVNDLNPEILDENPGLYFHLQQQKLIELIRQRRSEDALDFLSKELASFGEENEMYLDELEKTLLLLAFDDQDKSPMAHLLNMSQRQKIASELNAAILASTAHADEPILSNLLKLLAWSQDKLYSNVDFPQIKYLGSAKLSMQDENENQANSSSNSKKDK